MCGGVKREEWLEGRKRSTNEIEEFLHHAKDEDFGSVLMTALSAVTAATAAGAAALVVASCFSPDADGDGELTMGTAMVAPADGTMRKEVGCTIDGPTASVCNVGAVSNVVLAAASSDRETAASSRKLLTGELGCAEANLSWCN